MRMHIKLVGGLWCWVAVRRRDPRVPSWYKVQAAAEWCKERNRKEGRV